MYTPLPSIFLTHYSKVATRRRGTPNTWKKASQKLLAPMLRRASPAEQPLS